MSAVTTCPFCEQPLWVTEEMLGKTVSCLYCGKEFVAQAGKGGQPAAAAAEPAKAMLLGSRTICRASLRTRDPTRRTLAGSRRWRDGLATGVRHLPVGLPVRLGG